MGLETYGKDTKRDPNKFNKEAYKHAIAMIESSGGKYLETGINPKTGKHYSSAAGKYHFLYDSIKNDPEMSGITKRDFMNNPELQERIMDKALEGKLAGYTYGVEYAKKLKNEFGSDYDVTDLTALIHFVGAGNARKFLKDPENFVVPGALNMRTDDYLSKFRKHLNQYSTENGERVALKNSDSEKELRKVAVDNTAVASQEPKELNKTSLDFLDLSTTNKPQSQELDTPQLSSDAFSLEFRNNEFKEGGQMSGQVGGVNELVTLFENGGTHEENSLGGIPQGVGNNGKINLVEEGETKWNDYIFSNSFSLDGTYTGKDGNSMNIFEKGGNIDKDKKEVGGSNIATKFIRDVLPIPQNAAQLVASMVTKDSKYTTADGGDKANKHLYRSVRNAVKRTGNNKGGTEYRDYSSAVERDVNSLRMNAEDMLLGSALSPELEAATTYGRVSYDVDPETGNVKIYDTYDFNKTPNRGGAYARIRSAAGEASEERLDSTPKLIGEFNMNDNPDDVGFMDVLNNVLNPIDALDIDYGSIKKVTEKFSKIKKDLYEKGKDFINSFEDGGDLDADKDNKKNKEEPVIPSMLSKGVAGSVLDESSKYPLKFTKTQSRFHKTGMDIEIEDIRKNYVGSRPPVMFDENDDSVNFELAVKDEGSKAFLNRYNDPATREMMKGQTNLTDYDIDNMILRGLLASKQVGGNVSNSKASYDRDKHKIFIGDEYADDKNVESHERVHASGFDAVQGINLLDTLGSAFQQEGRSLLKNMDPDALRYLSRPHEAYGNFVEFRDKIGLKPGEKIDVEELKKRVKKSGASMENFYRAFNDENIVKALNTIAYEDTNLGGSIDDYKLA